MGASKSKWFVQILGMFAVVVLVAGCGSQTQMAMGPSYGAVAPSADAGPTSLAAGDSLGQMIFPPVVQEPAQIVASED